MNKAMSTEFIISSPKDSSYEYVKCHYEASNCAVLHKTDKFNDIIPLYLRHRSDTFLFDQEKFLELYNIENLLKILLLSTGNNCTFLFSENSFWLYNKIIDKISGKFEILDKYDYTEKCFYRENIILLKNSMNLRFIINPLKHLQFAAAV
jgi:hypothetical protein